MTTVSPFARSSVFDEPLLGGREQTVSAPAVLCVGLVLIAGAPRRPRPPARAVARCGCGQIEEMYSVPESFLEIEVRNPQTHGACSRAWLGSLGRGSCGAAGRVRAEDVHRLRDRVQGA